MSNSGIDIHYSPERDFARCCDAPPNDIAGWHWNSDDDKIADYNNKRTREDSESDDDISELETCDINNNTPGYVNYNFESDDDISEPPVLEAYDFCKKGWYAQKLHNMPRRSKKIMYNHPMIKIDLLTRFTYVIRCYGLHHLIGKLIK